MMTLKRTFAAASVLGTFATLALPALADNETKLISEEQAMKAALSEVGVEILGIRFDAPDTQWDVFVKSGEVAFEIEVDAETGKIVAAEQESLAEIRAELSGDLSHEGVEGDVDQKK